MLPSLVFSSLKVKGETNMSYICSRFYRALELIFGATEYTTLIDIWSACCVLAELLLGQPLFPRENAVDQLVEIIKLEACAHPFFDELREPNACLPNNRPLPPLFNFKQKVHILILSFWGFSDEYGQVALEPSIWPVVASL